ncbi:MAG: hypothetical protein LBT70_05125, partial [Holosporaceae bacterium]|nr:hypothetical protein [Holosporaceae bacterium]
MWYHFVNWRSERPYICPRDAATATTRVSCGVREIPEAVRRISKFICLTLFLIATAEVGAPASASATDIYYKEAQVGYKGAQVGDSKDYG